MRISLAYQQELSIRQEGEYLASIFVLTEEALNDGDTLEALRFVASGKKMGRYRSIVDFLFCEVAGEPWVSRCRAFYAERGPALRNVLPQAEIDRWDLILVRVLGYAVRCLAEERRQTWTRFRFECRALTG